MVSSQLAADKIDVLIVDGFSNHDWKQTTYVVKTILEKSELFHVDVSTSPSTPDDIGWQSWNPKFDDFDVVMLNCNNINNKEIQSSFSSTIHAASGRNFRSGIS